MSYVALYRKFRPQTFEDVKGQDPIITTFKNQIKANRVGHAYLFSGTRGTGKTTVAKIVAKAVNCENPSDGSPCGECPSCKAIAAGSSMNVIEIDAASNNGVEDIRQIREEVTYAPTNGRYKVYIIDEVHMLSKGAYNALLKTLEEPPAYVIFILATTEEQKIPITILSRCQRYNFKRISSETIQMRMAQLLLEENVEAEEKALAYIAKAADGSMRDALSLLDQCIAFYYGEPLTYEHVLDVLGAVDNSVFSKLLTAIVEHNTDLVIQIFNQVVNEGREIAQFVTEFTWHMRNLLVAKTAEHAEELLEMSDENIALLKEEAKTLSYDQLLRYIRILSELGNDIRYATAKRVLVETALIKLCKPQMQEDYNSLVERIKELERQVDQGLRYAPSQEAVEQKPKQEENMIPFEEIRPDAMADDIYQVCKNWSKIQYSLPASIRPHFEGSRVDYGDKEKLHVFLRDPTCCGFVNQPDKVEMIEKTIGNIIGKNIQVKLDSVELQGNTKVVSLDELMTEQILCNIEVED